MFHKTKIAEDAERLLSQGKPGDVISPQHAESVLGVSCTNSLHKGWKTVAGVIKRVEKTHAIFWRWDRDQKVLRCLTNTEKPAVLKRDTRLMQRRARRSLVMVRTMDFDSLTAEQRKDATVSSTVCSLVEIATSVPVRKTLVMFAERTPAVIDEAQLIRMLVKAPS